MRCKKCGAELPDGARFCYMCASPVEPEEGEKNTQATPGPAQTAGAGAARAEEIPSPVKLEGPLPVGAVPFVPMAPSPRSTYVQRRGGRPVKSSRPGSNSAPTTASGYSTSAWPENSAWSLEGRLPDDAGRMIERRNESDDPIGSAKNAINQVISSWSAASAERGEKKRKEKEIREAARRVQEQKREEERLEAEKAWREQEEKERLEAERAQREQREQEERRELELAELREAAAAAEAMREAPAEQEAEVVDGAQAEPVAPEGAAAVAAAESFLPEDQVEETAKEPVQQNEPAQAAAEEPVDEDDDQPTAAFEAQPDAGRRPAPARDERGLASLWSDESDDVFEAATTRDLSGATSRAEEAHKPGFAAVPRGAARTGAPRNLPFNPVAVVAVVIALVAVVALGIGVLGGGQKQPEPTTPEPSQQASEPQATPEPDPEPEATEVAVRASVEDYSWDELSQIADMIAGAKDQSSALEIEKKYNLVSAAGTLDGAQAKTLQLSDGTSVKMRIAGFRHDQRSDGSGVAGITFLADSIVSVRPMNAPERVDWSQTSLRAWLNGEFVGLLPDELSGKVVEVKKQTNRASDFSSQEETDDKVWLLSYFELVGEVSAASSRSGVYNPEGAQYQLFSDLGGQWEGTNEAFMVSGECANWWLRSPDPANEGLIIAPRNSDGSPGLARNSAIDGEVGVVPAFCL